MKYLCTGFQQGFDTLVNIPHQFPNMECKNLQSALKESDVVNQLIDSEVAKGFLIGPFKEPMFPNYRVSPVGVATGKYSGKKRLIVDLSSPHEDNGNPSINDLIDKDQCSLTYVRIDDAIKLIQSIGPGAVLCKTDISDAFKLIPIHPSQWNLFCIKWNGSYYYYRTLSFGMRSAPVLFDNLSTTICWIAKNNYDIGNLLHLLDDFLTVHHPSRDGEHTMALLKFIFKRLNIPLAEHKTVGPTCVLEFLGVILDSIRMEARLPLDKLSRITTKIQECLSKTSVTKLELLQLLGHLMFATRVIPPGRSFVSYLIALSSSVKSLSHHVRLSKEGKEDLRMWLYFLSNWNGVSLFYDNVVLHAYDMELYTDASSTIGYGGYFQGQWFSELWPDCLNVNVSGSDDVSMAFREIYPIVVSCMIWGKLWQRKQILFWCDNLAAVTIINKGRSKATHIMPLVR